MQVRLNKQYIEMDEFHKQIAELPDRYSYNRYTSTCDLRTFLIEVMDELLSNDKAEIKLL